MENVENELIDDLKVSEKIIQSGPFCKDYCLIRDWIQLIGGNTIDEEEYNEIIENIVQAEIPSECIEDYVPAYLIKSNSFWKFKKYQENGADSFSVIEALDYENWYRGIGQVKHYIFFIRRY